jgi:hypothetical protein
MINPFKEKAQAENPTRMKVFDCKSYVNVGSSTALELRFYLDIRK